MKLSRRAFTLKELFAAVAVIVGMLFCLLCGFTPIVGHLLAGWIFFLMRVVPEVRVNLSVLLEACVCIVGIVVGVHLFARWLICSLPPVPVGSAPRRWSFRSTLATVGLVVLAFTAGISAVGVTHQIGWLAQSPEPILRRGFFIWIHSQNNLKHIVRAFQDSEAARGMPPPGPLDEHGCALHGWQTHLLPCIEQGSLYKMIDLSRPWNDPVNAPQFHIIVQSYAYPSAPSHDGEGFALTHYALNSQLIDAGRLPSLKQIAEGRGTSNTILVGEARGAFKPWGHPLNWRDPAKGLDRSPDGFGSPVRPAYPVSFAMADGSVRTFTSDTDPDFLALLAGGGRK